jgi:hypothetical protein
MKVLLCFLLTSTSFAQYNDENIWADSDKNRDVDYRKVEEKPEVLLRDDTIIYDENDETGVRDAKHYTGSDKNRFHLAYHISRRLRNAAQFRAFEFMYARRLESWWLELMVNKLDTRFEEVSENKSGTAIGAGAKPDDLDMSFLIFGAGVSYKFKLHNHWSVFDNIYHTASAYATYINLTEKLSGVDQSVFGGLQSLNDLEYTGYGVRTDYSIHYRATPATHYGMRMSYNLGWVERPEEFAGESNEARRLNLAWLSLAFELGYYF